MAVIKPSLPSYPKILHTFTPLCNHLERAGQETHKTLLTLADGKHTFEVKTRDHDFNEDATPAVIRFTVVPPVWKQGWFVGLVILFVGITGVQTFRLVMRNRNLGQANLQIQEANRLKSQFFANMSHEMRTPLNVILGFSQLMTRDSGLTDKQKENLEVIGRSGEHLLGLINDVLDMSKIEAGQVELSETGFDLYRLLDTLEEMFLLRAGDKGLELIFERVLDVPQYIRADEGKLRQVLINLLGNAIKFTEVGKVVLRVSYSDEGPDTRLFFEVEDTGPGIASEEVSMLFEAFVQTNVGQQASEGTGLGLPISQVHVRLMGVKSGLRARLARGLCFDSTSGLQGQRQWRFRLNNPTAV